jgi:hypothetical protein
MISIRFLRHNWRILYRNESWNGFSNNSDDSSVFIDNSDDSFTSEIFFLFLNGVFDSFNEVIFVVNRWAEDRDYGIIKDRIKRRDDRLYRKFWIICDRDDKKKFKIVFVNWRRPNSGFKKIKYSMHAILVEKEDKDNKI